MTRRTAAAARTQLRRLEDNLGRAGLGYRAAACGEDGAGRLPNPDRLDRLEDVEGALADECRELARDLVAQGRRKQVMRMLHIRRKLASLVACGDVDILWRYVAFIDAIRDEARGSRQGATGGTEADDVGDD